MVAITKKSSQEDRYSRGNFVPSYDVFWKHIKADETEVDVSGLFSNECFEEWLSTRPGKVILHPEQSYQRVLYAHIRGADHRKPFPANVEKEILKLLRGGKQKNPWKKLFDGRKVDVGRRGFKSKGFHEVNQPEISAEEPFQYERPQLPKQECSVVELTCKRSRVEEPSFVQVQEEKVFPKICFDIIQAPKSNINRYAPIICVPDGGAKSDAFFSQTNPNLKTPWQRICETLAEIPYPLRKLHVDFANRRGVDIYSPAVYYMLNQHPDPRDLRYDWDFLLPPKHEQHFLPGRPIAHFTVSLENEILEADEMCELIFKGNIIGLHMFELAKSYVTILYALAKHIPEAVRMGYVWRREIFKRFDETPFIALHKVEIVPGIGTHITLQDGSDLYPTLLDKPFFV